MLVPSQAGLFSFISEGLSPAALAGTQVQGAALSKGSGAPHDNVQNMPVLLARRSPFAGRGGAEIISEGDALVPQGGADAETIPYIGDTISTYVVQKGDTLSGIAQKFNISVNTLRWANSLKKGASVSIGQKLVVIPVDGVYYTVKKGDTVGSIAKRFKADVADIVDFNGGDELTVGDKIVVPGGTVDETVTAPGKPKYVPSGSPAFANGFISPLRYCVQTQSVHGKNGVDLAASLGSPLYAVADGVAIIAKNGGWNYGYGNYVVLEHAAGVQTVYGHMQRVIIDPGERVSQGQLIGYLGSSGYSTGPHVHFEVRGAGRNYMDGRRCQ